MPNIHAEYNFIPEKNTFSDNIHKAIGLHKHSFFFIAYKENKIEYALHAGLNIKELKKDIIELKKVITNKFGNTTFNNTKLFLIPERFSLVPEGLFNPNEYIKALDYIFDEHSEHHIFDCAIKKSESIFISDLPIDLLNIAKEELNISDKNDYSATWLNKVLNRDEETAAYVNILADSFLITIIKNGKLQLFNRFVFEGKNDFLYFLLGSIQSSDLKNEEINLYLSGEISSSSPLHEQLSYYFKEVKFLQHRFTEHDESSIISHQFYPLIDL